jgi:hypothetical protein
MIPEVRAVFTSLAELSPARRFWVLLLLAVSLGLVAAAQRDLQVRPADQVRGNRLVWRVVCANALGALAYFVFGRRLAAATLPTAPSARP